MKILCGVLLGVVSAATAARADIYDDINVQAAERAADETPEAARQRWTAARARLQEVAPQWLPDYRHCALDALLQFRLDGPAVAATRRYDCTAVLVAGTVGNGGATRDAVARARLINHLSEATDAYYKAEIASLQREQARLKLELALHARNSVNVNGAKHAISLLRDRGTITPLVAAALFESVSAPQAPAAFVQLTDPSVIDFSLADPAELRAVLERQGVYDRVEAASP